MSLRTKTYLPKVEINPFSGIKGMFFVTMEYISDRGKEDRWLVSIV